MKQLFAFSQYESKKRVSAEEAMKHVYFRSLGPRIHTLPESKRNSKVLSPHFHLSRIGDWVVNWEFGKTLLVFLSLKFYSF